MTLFALWFVLPQFLPMTGDMRQSRLRGMPRSRSFGSIACALDLPTPDCSRMWYTEAIVAATVRSRPAMDCAHRTLDAS
jgi:hypothetical protein